MPQDLDLLQGNWNVKSLQMDGQPMPPEMLAEARVVVEGSRFTSLGMGAEYQGTLLLDPSARPPRLDLRFDSGPEAGNTKLGIYRLEGDRWKLCLATRGSLRPSKFQSLPASGIALQTLVRGPVAQAAKSAKAGQPKARTAAGPATELEGEWQMLSGVMDGKPMDDSLVKWVKRVTKGNRTTVMAGPQTMLDVEFTHDPAASPGTVDYLNLAGSHKGKKQQGIYRLEGDVLTVCTSAPGGPRPAEFASSKGDGRSLTGWKRV